MYPPLIANNDRKLPQAADLDRRSRNRERFDDALRGLDDSALSERLTQRMNADTFTQGLTDAVFGNSPYLSQSLIREPQVLDAFLTDGPDKAFQNLADMVKKDAAEATDLASVMRVLRIFKRRAALLIALADIGQAWPLNRITAAITETADIALSRAVRFLLLQAQSNGEMALTHPDDPERESGWIVLAMGKQGAYELNYSSDIDLIVFYDEDKVTYTGRRTVKEMFVRMTRDLVKIMDERTADGYVFRTDLRLRPDPGSTPPAISLDAAEIYYEGFGQNWERAAMIKARACAGDIPAGQAFLKYLRPFVWRKSLDFYAIQDIHSIKRQIYAHKGGGTIAVAGHNIKLGRGGIREIEFFAQTQQLIWGGRKPELRTSQTMEAIRRLHADGQVTAEVVAQLDAAYTYLRTLEHRLQMIDDHQTQTLPKEDDKLLHLALFAGHDGLDDFKAALVGHLKNVENAYADLFEESPSLAEDGNLVFTGGEEDPETIKTIAEMGYQNPSAIMATIKAWHHGRYRAIRSTRAKELLTELVPAILRALAKTVNPDQAFLKFDEFMSRLPTGVQLFAQMHSRPEILDLLAEIMGDAPRLAEYLARHPNKIEAVLSGGFYDPIPDLADLEQRLDRQFMRAETFEEELDIARQWNADYRFRVGVQVLRGHLDWREAGYAQSDIAEATIGRLMPRVEREFARAHGFIPGGAVSIIAMGKLGSREMTATSDVDLIVVYEVPEGTDESTGPRPLSPTVFYTRITQRLINAITVMTNEGRLYEVDMRLRPSGNKGPIATSFESFEKYHETEAWTWEHQALTRARVIYGQADFTEKLEAKIKATLCRKRAPDQLVVDVADMRERMAKERKARSLWEVKYTRGGLVDIEFIAQYLQLLYAPEYPDILHYSVGTAIDNIRAAGLLPDDQANTLCAAYGLWMTLQTILRQTVEGPMDEDNAPEGLKEKLIQAVGLESFEALKDHVERRAEHAYALFQDMIEHPAEKARARLAAEDAVNSENEE